MNLLIQTVSEDKETYHDYLYKNSRGYTVDFQLNQYQIPHGYKVDIFNRDYVDDVSEFTDEQLPKLLRQYENLDSDVFFYIID